MTVLIRGMLGLGDNIYMRAYVKSYTEPVYLTTPWQQIYRDLPNVTVVNTTTQLRTQSKNIQRNRRAYRPAPPGNYLPVAYGNHGPLYGMRKVFKRDPALMDLPSFGEPIVKGRYILMRPATLRSEWRVDTRNPRPEYLAQAAEIIRQQGIQIVSVADLVPGVEWALDPMPYADVTYHKGELAIEQILSLTEHAAAVVGPIGWIVPAAIAYQTPGWIICGGQGNFNAPHKIDDPRTSRLEYAKPHPYCLCATKNHNCNKVINNHAEKFTDWLTRTV